LTHSNDKTNRVFVVQQDGLIKVFPNDSNTTAATTFLNIARMISSSTGEEGLLGLAFHPKYAKNGYFYVNYTAPNPLRTVVARYSVSDSDPNRADSLSEFRLLEISQPYANHNGGMLMFGTDGYLYIGMGDGGSAGDPQNRAQNLNDLLGKILRINVDTLTSTAKYGIPRDNPLVGNAMGHKEEIYAWGFRNPWRFSQDPVTGEVWVGDVGQNTWEEIDLLLRGKNYGWRIMEGFHCYSVPLGCDTSGLTLPVKEYVHGSNNCSVTGGYVYRGYRRPDIVGAYIYADYCSGKIWMLRYQNRMVTSDTVLVSTPYAISSFGVDQDNELYICNLNGTVLRFAGNPLTSVGDNRRNGPAEFGLEQNFPNPFNPSTRIRYTIRAGGYVKLVVFNALGEEVGLIYEGTEGAGTHEVGFQRFDLPSGLYFCRLQAPGVLATTKMVLLR
jgi:hypothetical protein